MTHRSRHTPRTSSGPACPLGLALFAAVAAGLVLGCEPTDSAASASESPLPAGDTRAGETRAGETRAGDTTAGDTTAGDTTDTTTASEADTSTTADSAEGPSSGDATVAPDYAALFDGDTVRTIAITLSAEDYAAMTADMNDLAGEFGVGGMGPGGRGGALPGGDPPLDGIPGLAAATEACASKSAGDSCAASVGDAAFSGTCTAAMGALMCMPAGSPAPGGDLPGGGPPGGGQPGGAAIDLLARDPMWVPATVAYGDVTLAHVGFRYKGNSSLASSWASGISKLPFRLDFEKFEDDQPTTKNQRLHGFRKLTFSPGYSDASYLRDVLAGEVFADAGVPSARTAFYRVTLDVGQGPVYAGLYTMIEDPADAMMQRVFGSRDGNLYKPDGVGADWTVFDEAGFEKKNNEKEADFSDVEAAITALHADRSDPSVWRAAFEATFDVLAFLRYLAVNTALVNWDSYGSMAHNHYLYADDGVLVWIPWDNNMSLTTSLGMGGSTTVLYDETTASWPLIRYLLDDVVYRALFKDELELALSGAYDLDAFSARAEALHALIRPHVMEEAAPYSRLESTAAFDDSVAALIAHVTARHLAITEALAEQP